ncbi:peptidase family M1-domain-containing protein [Halteromyces radiatus]|uniref:peptidase family M1-domain-containing protein n=1 Tax=Halteromyces radiatus TaxID=101107 RepID=UPI00221E6463|nr:peptidase family M1-domain-containing protein [Halteromyces radiatus]KAI8089608.1 peptidase family M1-domain-containing protein [Halteromyces radiatus]
MCLHHSIAKDPSSLANLKQVKNTHLHLDWTISFDKKNISGHVILDLHTLEDNVDKVILDSSYLDIQRVSLNEQDLTYTISERHPCLGSALTIQLAQPIVTAGTKFQLKIDYNTTDKCTAIQFLEPEQTVGKKQPYLFSQCQAIHARAFCPCQDSPAIKLTYSASVTSPLPVIMSALKTGEVQGTNGLTTYGFEQRTSIPSYLIAIAAGNLVSREIGPRSSVWCEPEVIEQAAWEFNGTEEFIRTGEDLLTPYEWGRYDLLILPPSFPYGGMENPCLTFVTPTLLAGDRSAVDVVAHEIAHSWMGNLVTTHNWEHFWLNEGHTVFIERKITGRLHGEAERQFSAIIGWKALKESVELFGTDSPATVLKPDLSSGIDPDDYFSSVPYEKGFNLLYHIEKVVGGGDIFEPFLKSYVGKFAGQSITTEQWKDYLYEYFEKNHGQTLVDKLNTIDWNTWINGPGMPPVDPEFDTTLAKQCYDLADRWDKARDNTDLSGFTASDVESFSAGQKIVFLERLTDCAPLPHALIRKMDELYQLTKIRNADIRFRWQNLCVVTSYEPIYPEVVEFITEQGRMKFVRPLYRLLHEAKNGKQLAIDTFLKHKDFYHPIAATLIEKDIGLKQ